MARHTTWRSAFSVCAWLTAAVAGVALVGAVSVVVSGWLARGAEAASGSRQTAEERSVLGDYFGGVSAVFSGVALLLLIVTLLFQQRELQLQRRELSMQREELAASRNELRRSAEADMRNLHVQLTQMAMDDPSLAEVWTRHEGGSDVARRQHLFANLVFSHFVLALSWGSYSEEDLVVYARDLLENPAFLRYWNATREHKSDLPTESLEGRLFRIFDQAIANHHGGAPPPRS
ncbi:hypothetical protein GCM10010277_66860 [Streptomyces longisporoflavus]|uniref:DUF6082 family protein n=1 Tax=Streptomyces longisporoflavus TaxID=28044 RepID=UPI0019BEC727|nr:DUF6082 family protein [Streptomyces longisporoflavus]GGV61743.1 hypothetical protein GCM10010277_66860 [Streptomyces longisporoflavus]